MLKSKSEQQRLSQVYSAFYVKSKLLSNFFKIVLTILVILKTLQLTVESFQILDFPFTPVIILVVLQYLIFLWLKKTNLSANILLISLYLPVGWETLQTGGIYSDNLLYFLLITPACILLLDIRQTIIWTILAISFVIYLYFLEAMNPGTYFKAANFELFYYFNAIFWLFVLISGFMLTSGIILSKIFRQLEEHKEKLVSQHASLVATNQKLSDTEKSLRKSNKALEQFAHATAHDLKQPLRTMSSFAHLTTKRIQSLGIEDEAIQEYLDFIKSGSEEMTTLVEQLMEYAKIKANKNIQGKEIKLNNLIEHILLQLNLDNEYPNTTLNLKLDKLTIDGQPARIRQLFQNIIFNALKFSANQPAPQVTISSFEKQNAYWFCVQDNGIGIDPKNHEKIFQLFVKMNTVRDFKGSGIGLSTCKEIVDQMKGKMWVESTLGEGCKIFFSLPKSRVYSVKSQINVTTEPTFKLTS